MNVKIEVDIVIPPDFAPPEGGQPDTINQFLTLKLADYFPRLIVESCIDIPYLDDLEFVIEDIKVTYRTQEFQRAGGYIITIHFWGVEQPGQQAVIHMKMELTRILFWWFESRGCENVRIAPLQFEWHKNP